MFLPFHFCSGDEAGFLPDYQDPLAVIAPLVCAEPAEQWRHQVISVHENYLAGLDKTLYFWQLRSPDSW